MKGSNIFLHLPLIVFSISIISADINKNVYETCRQIVNEKKECTLDDVSFIEQYTERLYWLWTISLFRYIKIKMYIYENDDIYNEIANKNQVDLQDTFFVHRNRNEFIKNATHILKNAHTLYPHLRKYVPEKPIKFFQNESINELINIYISEKNNLMKSYEKYEMFEKFRDVANSKHFYYKSLSEINDSTSTSTSATQGKNYLNGNTKSETISGDKNNATNQQLKNAITFNESLIPQIEEPHFDYYDMKEKTATNPPEIQKKT